MKMKHDSFLIMSENDPTVLTAKGLVLDNDMNIAWLDQTGHERVFKISEIIEDAEHMFTFKRDPEEGGGIYKFVPLTSERYREFVEPYLLKPKYLNHRAE